MSPEYPDSDIYPEISALNAEFLGLLIRSATEPDHDRFGLSPDIVGAIASMTVKQLNQASEVPCLLLDLQIRSPRCINDSGQLSQSALNQSSGILMASVLTYARDLLHYESAGAFAALGLAAPITDRLQDIDIAGINRLVCSPEIHIQARFSNSSGFWYDLIDTAKQENPKMAAVSRLSALPLLVAESHQL